LLSFSEMECKNSFAVITTEEPIGEPPFLGGGGGEGGAKAKAEAMNDRNKANFKKCSSYPKSTNLVFVQKLTNGISCISFVIRTVFSRIRNSGGMIGRSREGNGLYLLEKQCMSVIEKN